MQATGIRLKELYTVINSQGETRGQYKGSTPHEVAKKVIKRIVLEENIKEAKFNILNLTTGIIYTFVGHSVRINKTKRIKTDNGVIEFKVLHKYSVHQI